MAERNYDQTGAQTGGEYVYINLKISRGEAIDRKCWLNIGGVENQSVGSFMGYLDNILPPEHREANSAARIPAHYEYKIILEAKDPADGQIKKYCLTLSSHWKNSVCSSVANMLAGALDNPAWTPDKRLCRFNFWTQLNRARSEKVVKAWVWDGPQGPGQQALPSRYPWNDDDNTFKGTPKAEKDGAGNPDWTTVSDFWHKIWIELAQKFGHDTSTATPHAGVSVSGNYPAPTPPAQAAPTTATLADRAFGWIEKQFEDRSFTLKAEEHQALLLTITQEAIEKLKASTNQKPTFSDLQLIGQKVYAFGGHPSRKIFDLQQSQKVDENGKLIDLATGTSSDLPF
jgi:hypothetical protein